MAKTDGSLQIQIPDEKSPGGKILWNRQYYVVPLEVFPYIRVFPGLCPSFSGYIATYVSVAQRLILGETVLSGRQGERIWRNNRSQKFCICGTNICGNVGGDMPPGIL